MAITSVSAQTSASTSSTQSTRKKELTQEDFLSLLMAQMKYQDPLNPMDNYQMSAQMAQLGTMEGINKLTQNMSVMNGYQASMSQLQTAGLIGKKVEVAGNHLILHQGNASQGSYHLSKAGKVKIGVYDSQGNLVRVMDEGTKDTAKQNFIWDGKNQVGEKLQDGTYTFKISAVDAKGVPISATSSMSGTVSGISFENGVTYVTLGSGKILLSDISAILS
jgi:flagellar basal-body rod modification protein FlgD